MIRAAECPASRWPNIHVTTGAVTGRPGLQPADPPVREIVGLCGFLPPLLVVATGAYAGEGFNCPALDTLFLAAPVANKGSLTQYAGRILRSHENKTTAEVHDYLDERTGMLAKRARLATPVSASSTRAGSHSLQARRWALARARKARLICSGAASRLNCLMGAQLGFMGFNSAARSSGPLTQGLRLRCRNFRAAAGGCHHAC